MKIVTWRMGFAGDVLFSTAALEGIKRKYPKSELVYGVWPQYSGVIDTNPHIDRFVYGDGVENRVIGTDKFGHPITKRIIHPDGLEYAKQHSNKQWEISHEKYRLADGEMAYWGEIHARQAAELGLLELEDMTSFKPQVYLDASDIVPKPPNTKIAALGVFSKNGADARLWGMRRGEWGLGRQVPAEVYSRVLASVGGKWEFERDKWPQLVESLAERGFRSVQLGGASDPRVPGAVDLCGKLTWRQSMGLLTEADVCITIDSFLLHAAVARKYALDGSVLSEGTPVVALLGPTDGRAMFPVDAESAVEVQRRYPRYVEEGCCPCFNSSRFGKGPCRHDNLCMRNITVEDILEGVEKALTERG